MGMNIDPRLQSTLAFQIAQKLDAKDGKQDGKIDASIWNEFVKEKGGKEIKNFITLENALKSITTYAVKQGAGKAGEADKLAKTWFDKEPPIEGGSKLGSTPKNGQIVQSETLDFTINENEAANLPIKDTEFVDKHKQAGKQVADELKTQLQHDWSPKAARETLGKINKDNAAYVVQQYGENLAADIDNVFNLDEKDVVKSVIKPLFEKCTELVCYGTTINGTRVTLENCEEVFKGCSLDELKKELIGMSDAVIGKEQFLLGEAQAHNKEVNRAKKFNEDIPKMQEQIQGANKLLTEIANMNPKPEIKENGKRSRQIELSDGRWIYVDYKKDGNIKSVGISHDTTLTKMDGLTYDGLDVMYYADGEVGIDTDNSNVIFEHFTDTDVTKIMEYVEKIFGKMEPIQE